MTRHLATLKDKLMQLDQKYLDQVEAYVEYLVFLQQKESPQKESINTPTLESSDENERLNILRQFQGDALFPEVNTSKYDVYEQ